MRRPTVGPEVLIAVNRINGALGSLLGAPPLLPFCSLTSRGRLSNPKDGKSRLGIEALENTLQFASGLNRAPNRGLCSTALLGLRGVVPLCHVPAPERFEVGAPRVATESTRHVGEHQAAGVAIE